MDLKVTDMAREQGLLRAHSESTPDEAPVDIGLVGVMPLSVF